ncbi:MAG: pentapeptide repeat-containing protein [Gemmataceae bacterium]
MNQNRQINPTHLDILHLLWKSDRNGKYYPLTRSEIVDRLNAVRAERGAEPVTVGTVSVFLNEMREKKLLFVYRIEENGDATHQVSEKDRKAALAKRDNKTAYGPALRREEVLAPITPASSSGTTTADELDLIWAKPKREIERLLNKRVLDDVPPIAELFIAPMAYWEEPLPDKEVPEGPAEKPPQKSKRKRRHVGKLNDSILNWFQNADKTDALRLLSGPAGAGKSSFARRFAWQVLTELRVPVVYVPLHRLPGGIPFPEALQAFCRDQQYPQNLLDPVNGYQRLLLVLDGLDELAKQGDAGEQAAKELIVSVRQALLKVNVHSCKVQVLSCGRPIAVDHANNGGTLDSQETFHLLPFVFDGKSDDENIEYRNAEAFDQRPAWWAGYAHANQYAKVFPEVLQDDKLAEFTNQPLLLMLLAHAYVHRNDAAPASAAEGPFPPNPFQNEQVPERLADVMAWLIRKVYDRDYDIRKSNAANHLSFLDFRDLLGLLGIAVWQTGTSRATPLSLVEKLAPHLGLDRLLKDFHDNAGTGTLGLLMAFYTRHADKISGAERTFEFSIKLFGEYLAACGLVTAIEWALQRLDQPKTGVTRGDPERWKEADLLFDWLMIAGAEKLTEKGTVFLYEEIARRQDHKEQEQYQDKVDLPGDGRQLLARLFQEVLDNGFPAEKMVGQSFQTMRHFSDRAEATLVDAIMACTASLTGEIPVLEIRWPGNDPRPHLERTGCHVRQQTYRAISFRGCKLAFVDFSFANLRGADLQGADLQGAYLQEAYLQEANLQEADLDEADLRNADLQGADLQMANMNWANLQDANLQTANSQRLYLRWAILHRAKLQGNNLEGANLEHANMDWANLKSANLESANLEGANLKSANLEGANLKSANLEGAILQGANLTKATYGHVRLDTPEGRKFLKEQGAIL